MLRGLHSTGPDDRVVGCTVGWAAGGRPAGSSVLAQIASAAILATRPMTTTTIATVITTARLRGGGAGCPPG
ncbi:hypothetical protein [Kribbella speibonae]|uniref:Uncharacterized protein n=1 Tax=Kribbella speibonae TaxID=1572660 RepID=A0ABY2A236_9ACTN|nr:hypothetical protein [Kribbella speibonae]TCC20429.1 hypothetical protein E0H58_30410 [Kribbella speibonae]